MLAKLMDDMCRGKENNDDNKILNPRLLWTHPTKLF